MTDVVMNQAVARAIALTRQAPHRCLGCVGSAVINAAQFVAAMDDRAALSCHLHADGWRLLAFRSQPRVDRNQLRSVQRAALRRLDEIAGLIGVSETDIAIQGDETDCERLSREAREQRSRDVGDEYRVKVERERVERRQLADAQHPIDARLIARATEPCPHCRAEPGARCTTKGHPRSRPHIARATEAALEVSCPLCAAEPDHWCTIGSALLATTDTEGFRVLITHRERRVAADLAYALNEWGTIEQENR